MAEMMERFYAHSIEGKPVDEWHCLEEHLKGPAEFAASEFRLKQEKIKRRSSRARLILRKRRNANKIDLTPRSDPHY
jgi:hypothetical protein